MAKTLKIVFLIILFISSAHPVFSQGLGFNGMDYRIEDRSSYDVFGRKTKTAKENLKISFDLRISPGDQFGYILRVKDKVNWNLSYESGKDSILLRLNEEGRKSHIKAALSKKELPSYRWHPVCLEVDIVNDSLHLSIGSHHFEIHYDINGPIKPTIIFGKSDYLIDVPAFAIRSLFIKLDKQEYKFTLDQIKGEKVLDSSHRITGRVKNPNWLTNDALEWKEIVHLGTKDIAGNNWNPIRKEFYYFDNQAIYIYNFLENNTTKRVFNTPCPVKLKLGSSYISADGETLYCYELFDEQDPMGWSVAKLDLNTFEWTPLSKERLDMPMNHHTGFIDPKSGNYTIFGGFGNMLYNGRMYSFDPKNGTWHQTYDECNIYPRYFTSSGTDENGGIYLFGGMGNESGEQVVGRQYFYDLIRIDSQTGQKIVLWDLDWKSSDQVPVRRLIVDSNYFYTLCYPEYLSESNLKLYAFNIGTGDFEVLGNNIPIISDKMRTNANLFLDKDLSLYIAAVQEFDDDIKSDLKLYTLSYPAFGESKIKSIQKEQSKKYGSVIATTLLLLVILLISIKRYRNRQKEILSSRKKVKLFKQEQKRNSIYLFGDFTVIDNKGIDITYMFTPQLQMILILLIQRGEKGLSSKRLSYLLWPDKDTEKVKNSRGVAINNLRKALLNVDGVNIHYNEGRYNISFNEKAYCDYTEYAKSTTQKDKIIDSLLTVASRGAYLKSLTEPLLDTYKERVENTLLPILQEEMHRRIGIKDYDAAIEIADMLTQYDPLDEDALHCAIMALRKQKRIEEALMRYAAYCAENKKIHGCEYEKPFNKI